MCGNVAALEIQSLHAVRILVFVVCQFWALLSNLRRISTTICGRCFTMGQKALVLFQSIQNTWISELIYFKLLFKIWWEFQCAPLVTPRYTFNLVWSRYDIWWRRSGSTLAHEMPDGNKPLPARMLTRDYCHPSQCNFTENAKDMLANVHRKLYVLIFLYIGQGTMSWDTMCYRWPWLPRLQRVTQLRHCLHHSA